jgi:site-specific DNA-cytosine methylase
MRLNTLELFAGSRSFSKVAEELGHNVYTTDSEPFDKIDVVCDILDFSPYKLPYRPDIIWASPPCTFFSVASIGKHWNKDHTPKTEQAKLGLHIIRRTMVIQEQNLQTSGLMILIGFLETHVIMVIKIVIINLHLEVVRQVHRV